MTCCTDTDTDTDTETRYPSPRKKINGLACFGAWVCAVLLLAGPVHAARLALVIGNDSYSQVEPLKNAGNDARLMAEVLKKAGFDVTEAKNLNRVGLWSGIDRFKSRIQKGDEVVFYFAGHGVQIGANQLLLPTDIDAANDAQVQRDGVPLVDVQDALKDARIALLLIDACRDNPFPKTGTRAIGGTRGLSPPDPSTGQIIMMSAGRNQKALDRVPGENRANGLFTWELSQALQTPGIEIRSLLESVKNRVDDKARQAGHEQRPSLVNDLRGNFYLFASLRAEESGQPSPPVYTGPSRAQVEQQAWEAASRANSLAGYEAYLQEYPSGQFASAARVARASISVPRPSLPPRPTVNSVERPQPIALLDGTLKKIAESGKIVLGHRAASVPISYVGDGNRPVGFGVDVGVRVVESLSRKFGRNIQIEYVEVTSANRIPLVQNGTVDLECGSTTNNRARGEQVSFSTNYLYFNQRLATKKGSGINNHGDLAGKALAVTTGTTSATLVRARIGSSGADFREIYGKDHSDSFQLVVQNRALAFAMDDIILAGLIANAANPSDYMIVGDALAVEPIACMMRKGDAAFKQTVDGVIGDLVQSGEFERLYNKWFMSAIPPRGLNLNLPMSRDLRENLRALSDRPLF